MSAAATKARYGQATHLATVRGHRDIPVHKEGRFWVCAYQVDYGLFWASADVTDLRPIPDVDDLA